MCESCDNPEQEPECDGCDCCQSCCDCTPTDCDCDSCTERRENEQCLDPVLTGPLGPGFVHKGP